MTLSEACELIQPAIPAPGGTWADLGAGTGLFTCALATLLGASGNVIAVDRDERALSALHELAGRHTPQSARILPVKGDFEVLPWITEFDGVELDGILLANALHFAAQGARLLAQVVRLLGKEGRVVVVEYGRKQANRWVPYPVPIERLVDLASEALLSPPRVIGERSSAFGGVMYCAVLDQAG